MNQGKAGSPNLDLQSLSEIAHDYKLLQARTSKEYVATMVDVVNAINSCPIGKLTNMEVDELRSQTGHLLYFQIRGIDNTIPIDIEYLPQLHSHFRKPAILVLKRIQRFLMAGHRRVLGKLEREQAFEKIMDMSAFDVSQKIRLCLDEMQRYQKMTELVRGGGRKLDILSQALQVPSRARFELLVVDRIIRDPHHQRHEELQDWIKESKFKGNPKALQSLISNGFQLLDNATGKILDLMENLSGLQFGRDNGQIDMTRNWYSLGSALPRGEDFIKSFTAEEKIDQKIKRLTYPMIRVGWDAERFRATKDRFLVELNIQKVQVTQLSNLFFDLENKIEVCTKPDGEVMAAIQTDMENGLLNIRERDDAEQWVRENKIKLQEVLMETYEALHQIKLANPAIPLPERIEEVIQKIKGTLVGDRAQQAEAVQSGLANLDISDLKQRLLKVEKRLDHPDTAVLMELYELREGITQRIDTISIRNIEFHKRIREVYTDFKQYENKVMELYGIEEELEQARVQTESYLLQCYRTVSFKGLGDKTLQDILGVVVEHRLMSIKKLDYSVLDISLFQNQLDDSLGLDEEDCIIHLDLLLQEIESLPKTEQLLSSLKDWEKDLKPADMREKESFLLENGEKLQVIADRARSELRERINQSSKPLPRRLRFEVFGLADCMADSLQILLRSQLNMAPRLASIKESEQLAHSLNTLEAQILEAQKITKSGGEAYKRLTQMEQKGQLSSELVRELRRDLEINFVELDQLLEETSTALKRIKLIQNKFGGDAKTDYLEVTLNINDLERLKDLYEFVDTVTMEDIKRFCVSYNLKNGMLDNLFEKARKKDLSVPKDIMGHLNARAFQAYADKRMIALPLKTAILKNNQEIFDAECHLLCHTLNLVRPQQIRKKAIYMAVLALMEQAKSGDHQLVKLLGLLWGRMQTRLFKFEPTNHQKNYEGNRQALITDVKEVSGGQFKRD